MLGLEFIDNKFAGRWFEALLKVDLGKELTLGIS